jgi:hypothetical protein
MRAWIGGSAVAATALVTFRAMPASAVLATGSHGPSHLAFASVSPLCNRPGNLRITDQFNDRIFRVDPLTQQLVWSFVPEIPGCAITALRPSSAPTTRNASLEDSH